MHGTKIKILCTGQKYKTPSLRGAQRRSNPETLAGFRKDTGLLHRYAVRKDGM